MKKNKSKHYNNTLAERIKKMLLTPPAKRRDRDHEDLANCLMGSLFFKERNKDFANYDVRDLTN